VTKETEQLNLNYSMTSDATCDTAIVCPTNQSSATRFNQEDYKPQPNLTIPSYPRPNSNESLDSSDSEHIVKK
jgi:hypothetical protein